MDMPVSAASSASAPAAFLFDDKLLIVKRPNNQKGWKSLTGLDSVEKVTNAGGIHQGGRSWGCHSGVVDITDIGGAGADCSSLLYLSHLSLFFVNLQTESNKQRFLENLKLCTGLAQGSLLFYAQRIKIKPHLRRHISGAKEGLLDFPCAH
jgi:hypothetical protein